MIKNNRINLLGPWPPPYGGVAVHMQDLINSLQNRFDITVFGYGRFYPLANRNIIKIYLNTYLWFYTLNRLNKYIVPGTILHNHSILSTYPNINMVNSFISFVHKKGLILIESVHDETLIRRYPKFSPEIQKILQNYYQRAQHIIITSETLKKFTHSLDIDENKISVITPLLPLENKIDKLGLIDTFINKYSPVITSICAFYLPYEPETIVKAFLILKKRYPKSGLILIKTGFAEDVNYTKAIAYLIKEYRDSVLILSDIPRGQVLYILQQSDCFIRGVKEESFGLSKIESVLLGTPVICTNTGETRFMTIYQYGDVNDLVQKTMYVLENKEDKRIQEGSIFYKQMAQTNFRKIIRIYDQCSKI